MISDQKVSMGTTTIALKYKDGIIICADSRTSSGSLIANFVERKVIKLNDHVAVAVSGSAADTRFLSRMVTEEVYQHELQLGKPCLVETVAALYSYMNHHYKDILTAGILVCGIDELGFHCFKCLPGGTFLEKDAVMSGSGSTYVYGILDGEWQSEMSKDEALALAKKLVEHAVQRDGSSGGVMRWMFVTREGVQDEDNWAPVA